MAKKEQIIFTVIAFVASTFIIAPAGWLINNYVSDTKTFREKTANQFKEDEKEEKATQNELTANIGMTQTNTKDIARIRERLDNLERRIYELSRKIP